MAELNGSTMTALSNPSIFYERRSKTKDLSIETPERSKETPVADENVVETAVSVSTKRQFTLTPRI